MIACNPIPGLFLMHSSSLKGLLEISPVERGVVSLFGVKSGLFVAMNGKGKLYGSVSSSYEDFQLKTFNHLLKIMYINCTFI